MAAVQNEQPYGETTICGVLLVAFSQIHGLNGAFSAPAPSRSLAHGACVWLRCILNHPAGDEEVGEGKGREGKGREGKGREGKGREGKGREGKGREGKGREGKGREGKGREGKGREAGR